MREKTNSLVGIALMFALVGVPASTRAGAPATRETRAEQRMTGMVEEVEPGARTVRVLTGTGHSLRTIVFHVGTECRITCEGRAAGLTDVKRGQVVVVLYHRTSDGCEAESIEASPMPTEGTRR